MKKLTIGIIAAVSVAVNFLAPKAALSDSGVYSCMTGENQSCRNEAVRKYIYASNINWNAWQQLSVDKRISYGIAICRWIVEDRASVEDVNYWIAGAVGSHGGIMASSHVVGAAYGYLCPAVQSDPALRAAYMATPNYNQLPDLGAYGRSRLDTINNLIDQILH